MNLKIEELWFTPIEEPRRAPSNKSLQLVV